MKLGMCVMTTQSTLTEHFAVPSHQSACLYVYPLILVRRQHGRDVFAATNTHETREGFFIASLSVRSASYQRELGDQPFPEFLVSSVALIF